MKSCDVCRGQGKLQLPCQLRCGGKKGCVVCSGMGWVWTTCTKCGGSGVAR